jgi:hypothetical protein
VDGARLIYTIGVIEYFMKNNTRGRFELMAQRAFQYKTIEALACK